MLTVYTSEYDGRVRKYYSITDMGLKRINEFKDDWDEMWSLYKFITKEDDNE